MSDKDYSGHPSFKKEGKFWVRNSSIKYLALGKLLP
jgi:hypothetical protein